jgi:hypothetical protein
LAGAPSGAWPSEDGTTAKSIASSSHGLSANRAHRLREYDMRGSHSLTFVKINGFDGALQLTTSVYKYRRCGLGVNLQTCISPKEPPFELIACASILDSHP